MMLCVEVSGLVIVGNREQKINYEVYLLPAGLLNYYYSS